MKLPLSSVWVGDKWVPLSKVKIIQYYTVSEKRALQFEYEGRVMESYVEFRDIEMNENPE
jgi:hypothetical protein